MITGGLRILAELTAGSSFLADPFPVRLRRHEPGGEDAAEPDRSDLVIRVFQLGYVLDIEGPLDRFFTLPRGSGDPAAALAAG